MVWFDVLVPVLALAVAGASILYIRNEAAKLDREGRRQHPAE